MGNTAAFFLGSAGNTAVFSQPYGERRRFFQPCPKCRPLRFFFRTASAPRNRSFLPPRPARRTIARRRRIQNAGGLQGRNFRGIARRSPGYAQAARRQISRAAAFAASRFLFVLLFFNLLRGEGFPPSLRIAAIASGRRRRRAMLLSACPSAGRSGRGSARRL